MPDFPIEYYLNSFSQQYKNYPDVMVQRDMAFLIGACKMAIALSARNELRTDSELLPREAI